MLAILPERSGSMHRADGPAASVGSATSGSSSTSVIGTSWGYGSCTSVWQLASRAPWPWVRLVATAIYAFFWTLIMFDWLGGFTGVNFLVVHCWPSVLGPGG